MRLSPTLICFALLAIGHWVQAATIRVPADQPTIQAGIDAAAIGDTVVVAPAIYVGPANKNLDFRAKNIVLRSESGPGTTIIDCEGAGRGFVLAGGLTSATVIDGFTVRNGNSGSASEGGGGMIVLGCSPTISHCSFADNLASSNSNNGGGGAIAFYFSSSKVDQCDFARNQVTGISNTVGGAVAVHGSQIEITGCTFSNNTVMGAGGSGGAICQLPLASITVMGCAFSGNQSSTFGGAIAMTGGGSVQNSTFHHNRAGGGGGIYSHQSTILDCIFEENVATSFGGALVPAESEVRRCTLLRNTSVKGGGIYLTNLSVISQSVLVANSADHGGGIYALHTGQVIGCTIAFNIAPLGGGLSVVNNPFTVEQSIIALNGPGEAVACEGGATTVMSCSDVYGNAGGDWVGCISDQAGTKGNLAMDPLFCDSVGEDLHLCADSPCAPEQTGVCGLIGAHEVGCAACGVTSVEATTWGRIKASMKPIR